MAKTVDIISDIKGNLYIENDKAAYITNCKYMKLSDEASTKLMENGSNITADSEISRDGKLVYSSRKAIRLTYEQCMLIKEGKSKIARSIRGNIAKVYYEGNKLYIDDLIVNSDNRCFAYKRIDGLIKMVIAHSVIEIHTGICNVVGESFFSLTDGKAGEILTKRRYREYDTGALNSIGINVIGRKRPEYKTAAQTMEYWNEELDNNRLVIYSHDDIEVYIEVKADNIG